MEYKAAIDIGGTKVTASLVDANGIICKVYQPVQLQGDDTTIPRQVDALIKYCCKQQKIAKQTIAAVGISTPSPFVRRGIYRAISTPNLCGGTRQDHVLPNDWREIPLQQELAKIYPRVEMENDGIAAVVAERLFGAGQGIDNLVYVTWSTGIGSGAYVDGHLIKGKNGNAPHLGHIYLVADGPRCGCGNIGDFEAICAGPAIARDYGATTEKAFAAYRKGDPKAIAIIDTAARHFARGLASMNVIVDAAVFVLGGSVYIHNQDVLQPLIEKEFFRSFPMLSRGVELRPSALDQYLGDIAALSLVMPEEWREQWQRTTPWRNAPKAIVLD